MERYPPDRERIRPSLRDLERLLVAIEVVGSPHAVDPGTLGEYAEIVVTRGGRAAGEALPDVAAHLASPCQPCVDDLATLIAMIEQPDDDGAPDPVRGGPDGPGGGRAATHDTAIGPADLGVLRSPDADISAITERPDWVDIAAPRSPTPSPPTHTSPRPPTPPAGPPDPPPPARSQPGLDDIAARPGHPTGVTPHRSAGTGDRLRRTRDILLMVAAAAILLMGLSLVGLAFLASGREAVRLPLAPQPAGPAGQPPATSSQPVAPALAPATAAPAGAPGPGAGGSAPPAGMDCPGSHPIKGNRASMIYHPPDGAFYQQTRPEACFATPADAEAAGYRRSLR